MNQREVYERDLVPLLEEMRRIAAEHRIPYIATFFDEQGLQVLGSVDHLLRSGTSATQHRAAFPDLVEVRGQSRVRRALEVAAAGDHNILLIGPRDAGKRFLSSTLPTLLPTRVGAGHEAEVPQYPVRMPNASISPVAFLGGGRPVQAGEVTLAHGGVLCLPDLHSFASPILTSLRRVVDEQEVVLARAGGTTVLPARFLLVASVTPCECGCYTDHLRACDCTVKEIRQHQKRLALTVEECFDLTVEVERLDSRRLAAERPGEGSALVRERVAAARLRQAARFNGTGVSANASIPPRDIERWCALDVAGKRLFEIALKQSTFTVRQAQRLLRVARTIADLWGSDAIGEYHVAEALQYRVRWAL